MKTTYLVYRQVNGVRRLVVATPAEWDAILKENRGLPAERRRYFIKDCFADGDELDCILEHNARNAEMVPVHIKEKRAYSVGDIMAMLDISRSSAYILIKKDFFRSHKIGNQIRISKVSFDEWLDGVSPTPRDI